MSSSTADGTFLSGTFTGRQNPPTIFWGLSAVRIFDHSPVLVASLQALARSSVKGWSLESSGTRATSVRPAFSTTPESSLSRSADETRTESPTSVNLAPGEHTATNGMASNRLDTLEAAKMDKRTIPWSDTYRRMRSSAALSVTYVPVGGRCLDIKAPSAKAALAEEPVAWRVDLPDADVFDVNPAPPLQTKTSPLCAVMMMELLFGNINFCFFFLRPQWPSS